MPRATSPPPTLLGCGTTSLASPLPVSRNVTAQSHLDVKLWSCHTLWNELLGAASVSLSSLQQQQQQSQGKGMPPCLPPGPALCSAWGRLPLCLQAWPPSRGEQGLLVRGWAACRALRAALVLWRERGLASPCHWWSLAWPHCVAAAVQGTWDTHTHTWVSVGVSQLSRACGGGLLALSSLPAGAHPRGPCCVD